jgi:hypothetical protein
LCGAEEVGVRSQRDDGGGVSELVGDVHGVAALGEEHAGVRVTQRMWGDADQVNVFDEGGERAPGVACAERCGRACCEHRVAGAAVR